MFSTRPPNPRARSRSRKTSQRVAALLSVIGLAVAGCASPTGDSLSPSQASDSAASTETVEPFDPQGKPSASGAYLTFADYEANEDAFASTKVVLFFSAIWCSTCKRARDNIEADLAAIPADLTIVVADFDTAIELRRTYGVGIQHTFVFIDNQGNEIKKWAGSVTTDDIYEKVQ